MDQQPKHTKNKSTIIIFLAVSSIVVIALALVLFRNQIFLSGKLSSTDGAVELLTSTVKSGGTLKYRIVWRKNYRPFNTERISIVDARGKEMLVSSEEFYQLWNNSPHGFTSTAQDWITAGEQITAKMNSTAGFMDNDYFQAYATFESKARTANQSPFLVQNLGCGLGNADTEWNTSPGGTEEYAVAVLPKTSAGLYTLSINSSDYCDGPGPSAQFTFNVTQ